MRSTRLAAAAIAAALIAGCGDRGKRADEGAAGTSGSDPRTVTSVLAEGTPAFVGRDAEGGRLWKLTRQFYQKRGDAFAWIEDRKPRREMDELIAVLQAADREGLDPALYNVQLLTSRRQEAGRGFLTTKGFDEAEAADLDVWLTYLYLRYASDVTNGIAGLSHADPSWKLRDKRTDPGPLLEKALAEHRVGQSLQELTPAHQQYTRLREALAKYRDIAQRGGWPLVPQDIKLKPGQRHPHVLALARRLAATGDYAGPVREDDPNPEYGADLQEAVKRFQRRHGLEPDAVVGRAAAAQMNVPADARVQQIALNLERWRWLPRELGDRHILVNLPEYRLEVWENGQVPLSMRVVVGKKDTPTPIFADDMTYVVFSPYWNVPSGIARNETVPSALRDPAFLQRTNMEVLDKRGEVVDPSSIDLASVGEYRFRQRPGSSNSLGLVKFMFPNQFNVYLHDTPADSLFARATRSFSHGCVRVEQPQKLAEYVLGDQPDWTPERIAEAMHAGTERSVKLRRPLPVYLGYWTARVSADGILQFRDDIYGIDARQTTLLAKTIEQLKLRAAAAAMTYDRGNRSSPAADRSQLASIAMRQR
ncbi:MAG TPA: L,D-transpeptidase family protein [Vicinamibacterales bacterium]|nr:L,D-transpeptidase family protein [Vicinamibacterales bacterium]